MNSPPFFNAQFFDIVGTCPPLAAGFLHTYISGTTTNQTTYTDAGGLSTNANPILLDAAGRCQLWLNPSLTYTFVLKRADLSTVATRDGIAGCAKTTETVSSINGATGVVIMAAPDIDFATGTSTPWFVGVNVAAALDSIIGQAVILEARIVLLEGPAEIVVVPYAATISVNLSGRKNNAIFRCALTGNVTVNFTGGTDGQSAVLELAQDIIGSRLVTLGTGIAYNTTHASFTATTTASRTDTLYLLFNNAAAAYKLVNVVKGSV